MNNSSEKQSGQKGVKKVLFLMAAGVLLAMCLTFAFAQKYWSGAAPQQQQRPRRVATGGGGGGGGDQISLKAGGNLQKAVNAAAPGDTIILEAGATYVGPVTLPNKGATAAWITIQSSRLAELTEGVRVAPSQSHLMAKIVTATNGESAIYTAPSANHYRLLGLELSTASESVAEVYGLLRVGEGSPAQDTLAEMPSHFQIDRCYIHGTGAQNIRRGLALHSAHTDVTNSYLSNFKWKGMEAQAIIAYNGTGPYRIINNYLEGAGENVMFGGSTGGLNVVPTGVEIRRNHFYKPPSWRGAYTVKNLLEFKTGRDVVVEGNVFENNWADAQVGYAILFTPRPNDSGSAAVVEDVLFTNNVVRNTGGAVNILGADDLASPPQKNIRAKRIHIVNNVFENVSSTFGDGAFLKIGEGAEDITVDHNTVFHTGNITMAYGAPMSRFRFTNNLVAHNALGIHGDSAGVGNAAIKTYFPGSTLTANTFVGAGQPEGPFGDPTSWYPARNYFPRTWAEVGFVGQASGDYRLKSGSPFKNRATDGKDVGCDMGQLKAAIDGAVK